VIGAEATSAADALAAYTRRYARPLQLGCCDVAHRDLGFCAVCLATVRADVLTSFPAATEAAAWRLLAIAERGAPDTTERTS
jgi:hypothetical protein